MPVKFFELAAPRLLVEPLRVARLGDLERRVDEDLDELALARPARAPSARSARNGEMKDDEHDQAGVDHQLRHLADAADVLDAVGVGEAEVACSARGGRCRRRAGRCGGRARAARFSTRLAIVDLPAPDRPVNQSDARPLALERRARRLVDVERLPVDVGGAPQREADHARADGLVGEPVDQDEAAGVAVRRRRDRRRSARSSCEVADADLVQLERLRGQRARACSTSSLYLSG